MLLDRYFGEDDPITKMLKKDNSNMFKLNILPNIIFFRENSMNNLDIKYIYDKCNIIYKANLQKVENIDKYINIYSFLQESYEIYNIMKQKKLILII